MLCFIYFQGYFFLCIHPGKTQFSLNKPWALRNVEVILEPNVLSLPRLQTRSLLPRLSSHLQHTDIQPGLGAQRDMPIKESGCGKERIKPTLKYTHTRTHTHTHTCVWATWLPAPSAAAIWTVEREKSRKGYSWLGDSENHTVRRYRGSGFGGRRGATSRQGNMGSAENDQFHEDSTVPSLWGTQAMGAAHGSQTSLCPPGTPTPMRNT